MFALAFDVARLHNKEPMSIQGKSLSTELVLCRADAALRNGPIPRDRMENGMTFLTWKASFRSGTEIRPCLAQFGESGCDPRAVGGIGLGAIGDMTLLDVFRSAADLASRIVEQRLLLGSSHLAEEIARLLIVVVVDTMVPVRGRAIDLQRRLVELRLVGPLALAIGEVGGSSAEIAVSAHGAVAVIAMERAFRRVDRDVVVIDPRR
jgi:hypothetical protein